ncbi:MAG: hypothetical protein SCH98_00730 [Deferrisomatales bacterium]|nr:hypothetical protein [Deferrisomatales bacterium]
MTSTVDVFRRFRLGAAAGAGLLGLGGAALLGLLGGSPEAKGFLLGSLASAAAVHLLGTQIARHVTAPPRLAGRRARLGSLLRTGLRAGALGAAYALPGVSLGSAALGLFAGPAVLLAGSLLGPCGGD